MSYMGSICPQSDRDCTSLRPTEQESSMSILTKAQELIHGDRNVSYGHPRENFKAIADQWNAYLANIGRDHLEPLDVANMMILMKTARVVGGVYHEDSYTDIAGYAGTAERLQEPETPTHEVREPRVWDRLADVPVNVVVQDKDEDYWKRTARGARLGRDHDHAQWNDVTFLEAGDNYEDSYSPFIEQVGL